MRIIKMLLSKEREFTNRYLTKRQQVVIGIIIWIIGLAFTISYILNIRYEP